MTAPLKFALVPVEPTQEMSRQTRAGRISYDHMLAASPGNDLLERIELALTNAATVFSDQGMPAYAAEIAALLNELGGGHG